MFDHLGKFVARRWAWVLVFWIIGVAAVRILAPSWSSISQDDDVRSFPPHYDSVRALDLRKRAFPADAFNSEVVIVVERRDGELSPLDFDFVDTLAARLTTVQRGGERRDATDGRVVEDRYGLHEFVTYKTPKKGPLLVSQDKEATLIYAGCDHTFMAEKVLKTVEALRHEIQAMRGDGAIPAGIEVAVTGSSGVGADLQIATNQSLHNSFRTTIALVIAILLMVYRSPVVAMNPLATIGVSVVTAMSTMALLTLVPWMHFQVMKITEIFVVVVLFGAGTDYCLFLIARYREELEKGADRESALRLAVSQVGGALAASAATVVVGLGMMVFADFGKFRYTGPAVAISLAVALVGALTLTPALLRLAGPFVFWPFSTRRHRSRPSGHAPGESPEDPESTMQQRFWESMSRKIARWPAPIWTVSVLILLPFAIWGLRLVPSYDFLSELDDSMDSRIGFKLIDRDQHFPKGTLGRLTILFQAPDGSTLDFRTPDVRKDVAELSRRITTGGTDQISHYAPGMVAQVLSLTSPLGKPLPLGDRTEAAAQKPSEPVEPAPEQPSKEEMVEPKADQPKRPSSGLGGLLGSMTRGVAQALKPVSDSGAVDRVKQAVEQAWKDATEHYVSQTADGRVMRMDVVFNVDPFSKESLNLRDGIDRLVREFTSEAGTTLSGTSHTFAGITASTYDLEKITQADQKRINRLVVIAVYIILVLLLRQPLVCIYLMITVLFSYYATLGMTEGVFRFLHLMNHPNQPWLGLDWKVAFFLFIILVAVGEDYNILLMSRVVEEERKYGTAEGVRIAVARTGGIITSCGIIMAGTFGSMATGTLAAVIQLGFALALGVLLDTFVVRPLLVPAFLLMAHNWRQRLQTPHSRRDQPIGVRTPKPVGAESLSAAEPRGLFAILVAWLSRGFW